MDDPKPTPHRRVTPDRRATARGGRRSTDSQEARERRAKQIAQYLSQQTPTSPREWLTVMDLLPSKTPIHCGRCASAAIALMEHSSAIGWVVWLRCTDCGHVWNVPKTATKDT